VIAEEASTEDQGDVRRVVLDEGEEPGEPMALPRSVSPGSRGQASDYTDTSGQGASCGLFVTGLPKVLLIQDVLLLKIGVERDVVVLHFSINLFFIIINNHD